jgi:hypothetical protein
MGPPDPTANHPAENALIGAALINKAAAETVATIPGPAWHHPTHARWATAITQHVAAGQPIDIVTLAATLQTLGGWREDDTAGLLAASANSPVTTNHRAYAALILDAWHDRRYRNTLHEISRDGLPVDTAIQALTDLAETTDSGNAFVDVDDLLDGADPMPTLLTRTDGTNLITAGHLTWLQAAPGIGKSFLACHLACQLIPVHHARNVIFWDFETNPKAIVNRMLDLGAHVDDIRDSFRIVKHPRAQTGHQIARQARDLDAPVVILDGVAESIANQGLDENVASDVAQWVNTTVRPIQETGAAVVLIDHSRVEPGKRGARGSSHKLAACDLALELTLVASYSRTKAGKVAIKIVKDRYALVGALGSTAAIMHITPNGGGTTKIELRPENEHPSGEWVPTHVMELVSRYLEGNPNSGIRLTRQMVKAKNETIDVALEWLVRDGYVSESAGDRGARLFNSIRPYREDAEQ